MKQFKLNEQLELVPVRNNYKWISYLAIVTSITVITLYLLKPETIKIIYKVVHPDVQNLVQDIELSEEGIVKCLHENGCVLPNVAVAQARLESNLGKSNIGKNAKNMFGIVHHKCKYVTGKHGVYATYDKYEDNIKCYIHIQDHYLKKIDGVYASDLDYISKIKSMR
jgi:hypothetical protein